MKNEILYQKTVQILVDAYMNDMLVHGDCAACAVGNIIAANNNLKIVGMALWHSKEEVKYVIPCWVNVFASGRIKNELFKSFNIEGYEGGAALEIDSTGYSVYDLAEIEFAFESANKGKYDDEWMFNGLMAVIDALDIIHENTDEIATVSTKKRFAKV